MFIFFLKKKKCQLTALSNKRQKPPKKNRLTNLHIAFLILQIVNIH